MKLNSTQKIVNSLFWHLWETEGQLNALTWAYERKIPVAEKHIKEAKKWAEKSKNLLIKTDIVALLNSL